ncbi:unnamed protein product [Zymoseptoria tritici ST99CH_3D7]|uniref:Uncharacterized protein n=1 Tax=Zymoseptoria tritici (strain ST99CH_3D7) TaxID=1276538 RepID=A0A1X7S9N4_ZYMT9|nr:unnamed protein product [Zymoseptoria tritici ST99CH_3D7]
MFPRTSGRKTRSRKVYPNDWQHEDVFQTYPSSEMAIRSKQSPMAVPFVPTSRSVDCIDTLKTLNTTDPTDLMECADLDLDASSADVTTTSSINQASAVPTTHSEETDATSGIGCTTSAIDTPSFHPISGYPSSVVSVDDPTSCQAGEHTIAAHFISTADSAADRNTSDATSEEDTDSNAIARSHAVETAISETSQKASPNQAEENTMTAFHPVDIAMLETNCAWWLQGHLQMVPRIPSPESFDWDQIVVIPEEEDWKPWLDNSDIGDEEEVANLQAAVEELEQHYAAHAAATTTIPRRRIRLLAWVVMGFWLVACVVVLRRLKL